MRTRLVFLAGLAAGLAFTLHCGQAPAYGAGGDVGSASDAGTAACDCPAPPKPVVLEHACDSVHEETFGANIIRKWYAEIPVDGLKATDAPLVSVVTCDRQCISEANSSPGCPDNCPSGDTCTGYDAKAAPCASAPYTVEDSKIVVACGGGETTNSLHSDSFFGYQYQRAIVRIFPSN